MSEINTTPLVDVMLVLLIVFMITIPVITHTVPVELPKVRNEATKTAPENINLSVNRDGQVFWNQSLIPDSARTARATERRRGLKPQPEVHVRADKETRYEHVGRVILTAQRAGIQKVGFITEPGPRRQRSNRRPGVLFHGNECRRGRRRRAHDGYQHDAADRRHVGAADHVHHHAAGDDACGKAGHAADAQYAPPPVVTEPIRLDIDWDGTIIWNGNVVQLEALEGYFRQEAAKNPQPELHVRPDRRADYDTVAKVLAIAQRNGMQRIGFVGNEQFMD